MNSNSPLELVPIQNLVTHEQRARQLKQRGYLIWFTGLSGSGKSTLASRLELRLHEMGFKTYLLDGDGLRSGLNKDLPFTKEGRSENIRRVGEVSKLFIDAGLIVLAAFISPFEEDRKLVKLIVGDDHYTEVFVDAPLEICEARDVKGLYRKARAGKIANFTGIDSPYERPLQADVKIETHLLSVDQSLSRLIEVVHPRIVIELS